MLLSAGTRLGPYEIVSQLGAGGMGEVYRARDSNLGRSVAIKVLPSQVANDHEMLDRFRREARVLASLNHPNIASIYGFEDSDKPGLVMELVEGQTLADRLRAGPMPVDEALPIAKQICEALEYAHERGIIHRDVKPANIKVTADGAVKLLDFGLAKALEGPVVSSDVLSSPTLTNLATQAGVILGTATYMPPEQAKGRPVDRRADIWGFWVRPVRDVGRKDGVQGRKRDGHARRNHQDGARLESASSQHTEAGPHSPPTLPEERPEAAVTGHR
jgi:serine/threonine protein kinase